MRRILHKQKDIIFLFSRIKQSTREEFANRLNSTQLQFNGEPDVAVALEVAVMHFMHLKLRWKKLDSLAKKIGGAKNIFFQLFGNRKAEETSRLHNVCYYWHMVHNHGSLAMEKE